MIHGCGHHLPSAALLSLMWSHLPGPGMHHESVCCRSVWSPDPWHSAPDWSAHVSSGQHWSALVSTRCQLVAVGGADQRSVVVILQSSSTPASGSCSTRTKLYWSNDPSIFRTIVSSGFFSFIFFSFNFSRQEHSSITINKLWFTIDTLCFFSRFEEKCKTSPCRYNPMLMLSMWRWKSSCNNYILRCKGW